MGGFTMYILCTDDEAYNTLKNISLPKAVVIKLSQIEDPQLLQAKSDRTESEYCWTLKPAFLTYVLNNYPHIDIVTHVDADLYFFSDPFTIFHEGACSSVLVTNHLHEKDDDINSGFVSFRRDSQGLKCLEWWKQKCLNWCFFRKEDGKFGDQEYLNKMLADFAGVHVIKTPGVNIAPWNSYRFEFSRHGTKIHLDKDILLFYHFCGFRLLNASEYAIIYHNEDLPIVYEPYINELRHVIGQVERVSPGFCNGLGNDITPDEIFRRGLL